jgi:C1A family cysteine protease
MSQYVVTQFMDLTPKEFKQQFANLNVSSLNRKVNDHLSPVKASFGTNWKGRAVTGVKNQGQCGSCWAFSATGAIEGCWALSHTLTSFSESEILDCMTGNAGCNGGDPRAAINWAARNGGLMTEAAYPYVPRQQSCHQKPPYQGSTHGAVSVSPTENALRTALTVAPLSVCVDATPLQYYQGGIISSQCNERQTDHAVLLVADENNVYTCKNSWGSGYGESGYFRMAIGQDCLGITSYVTRAC